MNEVAYQGRRKPFTGNLYDMSRLATYAPANLGLYFTSSKDVASKFGNYVDQVNVETDRLARIGGTGDNLRNYLDRIVRIKNTGKFEGVRITNVIDGVSHDALYIIWNSKAITSRKEIVAPALKELRSIFPMEEDTGTAAMGTSAVQGFDEPISFIRRKSSVKKKKPINKNK